MKYRRNVARVGDERLTRAYEIYSQPCGRADDSGQQYLQHPPAPPLENVFEFLNRFFWHAAGTPSLTTPEMK